MNGALNRILTRLNRFCNWIAVIVEIVAIIVVSYGNYLEKLYCQDSYTWIITLGALIAMSGGFIQKKLPWACTQRARKVYEEHCSKHEN